MVDYSNARILRIENVDLPIHILGVEAPAMLGCFWMFLDNFGNQSNCGTIFSIGV